MPGPTHRKLPSSETRYSQFSFSRGRDNYIPVYYCTERNYLVQAPRQSSAALKRGSTTTVQQKNRFYSPLHRGCLSKPSEEQLRPPKLFQTHALHSHCFVLLTPPRTPGPRGSSSKPCLPSSALLKARGIRTRTQRQLRKALLLRSVVPAGV